MSTTTYHVTAQRADSFTHKQIAVTFDIALPDGGRECLTLAENHRIYAKISHKGMGVGSQLELAIEGMSLNNMNRLSYISNYPNVQNPQVTDQSHTTLTVKAGLAGKILKNVFIGNLEEAYADFNSGSAIFHVTAHTITPLAQIIPEPLSFKGSRAIPEIFSEFCAPHGLSLIDHGGWKGAVLKNHYKGGSLHNILDDIMKASGGVYDYRPTLSEQNTTNIGTLHIWGPYQKDEETKNTPLISAKTGLIGYPKYSSSGISLTCLFRNDLHFYEPLKVESAYIPAGWSINSQGMNHAGEQIGKRNAPWNGLWRPIQITHEISSEGGHGADGSKTPPWTSSLECQITNWNKPHATKK